MTWVLLVYTCVVLAAGILRYGRLLRSAVVGDPVLTPATFERCVTPAPGVSVVVAARDEEENIGECIESVLAQDYPNFDVTVVDDRSEDRTAEIVEEFAGRDRRVRLIRNRELPASWTGRNHALHLGALDARGEFLLFTDADTVHAPRNITQTVTCAVTRGVDLLSLVTRLRDRTFWQKLVHPVAALLLMTQFPLGAVNDPKSKTCFANGQYVLIRRKVYDAVGGRASAPSEFMDLALARRVKEEGFRLYVAHASGGLSMTQGGRTLAEIWRMWTRVFIGAFERSSRRIFASLLREVFLFLVPLAVFVGVAAALAAGRATPLLWTVFALNAAIFAGHNAMGIVSYRLANADLRYLALAYPAGVILAGMLLDAWVKLRWNRSMMWKGSRVPARRDAASSG